MKSSHNIRSFLGSIHKNPSSYAGDRNTTFHGCLINLFINISIISILLGNNVRRTTFKLRKNHGWTIPVHDRKYINFWTKAI
jgi:hypothetical protein